MKLIDDMDQNTDAWLEWRQSGLGGSDAPIIMGVSPFKKPRTLWAEKLGAEREPINEFQEAIMQRGHDLEPYARDAVNDMLGEFFVPMCGEHDQHPWMLTSFDGVSENGETILEIKCPGELGYQSVVESDQVPEHYWPQVQHQLAVSGAARCIFAVYRPEISPEPHLIEVFPDLAYIEGLIRIERGFWEAVANRDFRRYEDAIDEEMPDGFAALAAKFRSLDAQMAALSAEQATVKAALLEYLPDLGRIQGCGVEVSKSSSKGQVDWKLFLQDLGIDTREGELYRKEGSIRESVKVIAVEESTAKPVEWAF
ncbi:YqaJ viral recombinase family protein [Acidithiobacillus ferrooxidans]|nr:MULTISPECIES: YqaJ viral recombinase family protein [Acidithiobacillus]MBN6744330.1 YqaJ viral recombinase family protein [Acidithiobacillus sp. MC2.2]MBN6747289.1 YqaJ viral recombinase family protein [Acidithiobacillus sp. PG05]